MGLNPRVELMSIGALSAATGCPAETIRYYERRGLLRDPPRTGSGRRVYDASHVRQLDFVLRARALGFSLDRVGMLARLAERGDQPRAAARAIVEAHLNELRNKIAELQDLARRLEGLIGQTPPDSHGGSPIIAFLNRDEDAA
jgi:MerR family mercuric resistance operon transcriptional regulator